MTEETFPEEMSLVIVEDLYKHYTLGYDEDEMTIHIFCERCDDIVGTFDWERAENLGDMDLYEFIIDTHEEL